MLTENKTKSKAKQKTYWIEYLKMYTLFGGGPFDKKDFKIDMLKKTSVKLPGGG